MPEVQRITWIFACHDYNRVSAMSALSNMAQYFSDEYAISTVRSRFSIPEYQPVRFVKQNEWGAPNVTATQVSFDVDMAAANGGISQYLMSQGCSSQDISAALNALRGIPNPNLGILFLCVDLPNIYQRHMMGQPITNPAITQKAKPEYRPSRALWASAGIFVLTLLMILFFTLLKNVGPIAYPIDAYTLLTFALLGCGLFMLLQRGPMYKLLAVLTFVICYFFEIVRMQFLMTMAVDIRRLFNFSSPAYVQNMIRTAIPIAIAILLGVLFMFLKMQIAEKLKLTAWISSVCIFIYFVIILIPQFSRMPINNLFIQLVIDIINVLPLLICIYLLNSLSSINRDAMKVGTGAIVWLSICMALTAVVLALMITSMNNFSIVSLIFSLLGITGYILILCGRRAGFLISVFSVSMTVFLSIFLFLGQSILTAGLSLLGFINPLITWLLIRNAWKDRTSFGKANYMQFNNR